jgi:hypothetical protein
MIDEKLQEKLLSVFDKRFQDYNTKVLEKLGNVIKQFKDLTPSQAYELGQQLKYNTTVKDLLDELSKISGLSVKDLKAILEKVAKENIGFADTYYKSRGLETPIYSENKALQRLVNSVYNITGKEFKNISKSTGFRLLDKDKKPLLLNINEVYKEVIDRSVIAVSEGKESYQQVMRNTLRQLSESGVRKIEYESGYSRRIDTSVRMNVLDGMRQVANESQQLFGQEFDSDGIEISVHQNPADDHSIVQGRQFSNKEYEKLQETGIATDYTGKVIDINLKKGFRPISTLNCYHYIFSIVLGVSKPRYSEKELQDINEKNKKGFEFEGKHYTMYEGTQLQRKIETAIREAKDTQILAKSSGDDDLVLQSQTRITQLTTKYKKLCNVSGLPDKLSTRASVSGYKRTKINKKPSIVKFKNEVDFTKSNHPKPILLEKIERKQIDQRITYYEDLIRKSDIENAIIVTKNNEVYQCFGNKDNVWPDIDLPDKLENAIVTHNHLKEKTSFTFSNDDISFFEKNKLKKLRGTDYKYVYELDKNGKPTLKEPLLDEMVEDGSLEYIKAINYAIKNDISFKRWRLK